MSELNLPFHSSPIEEYNIIHPTAKNHWPTMAPYYKANGSADWFKWANSNNTDFTQHRLFYNEVVQWIKDSVPDWRENARWRKVGDCFYVRLRNDADATMFVLKFGKSNDCHEF